jgi:hypothetical protein
LQGKSSLLIIRNTSTCVDESPFLDDALSKEIEHKITGYPDEETFFIEKLASGVAKLLLHFIQIKPLCVF